MLPCGLQMRRCGSNCNVLLTSIRVLLDQVHDCSIVNITMPPVLRCPLPCAPVATSSAASLQIADQVKRSVSSPVCVLQLAHNPHGPCDGSPARWDIPYLGRVVVVHRQAPSLQRKLGLSHRVGSQSFDSA